MVEKLPVPNTYSLEKTAAAAAVAVLEFTAKEIVCDSIKKAKAQTLKIAAA